jgi:hypothetical protein
MWGDDRTSSNFEAPPPWFYYFKFAIQISSILLLFFPFRLRRSPSLLGGFLAIMVIAALHFVRPILEAEQVLINSSIQVSVLAIFLAFAQPNAALRDSDIKLLFYLFLFGFILQIGLFLGFDRMPAHSITDIFVRFNGITNDSLAAGLIIPLLIPWAASGRYPELKILAVMAESIASGSLFSVIFVPLAIVGYLIYQKMYRPVAAALLSLVIAGYYFYGLVEDIIEIKLTSILIHLRFFLNLSGAQYAQSTASCSEEFCESFIESGLNLSPTYMMLFYALLITFILRLWGRSRLVANSTVVYDSLRISGAALIVGSFVHPVPLIPFAVPLFLILSSLYLGEARITLLRGAERPRIKAEATY